MSSVTKTKQNHLSGPLFPAFHSLWVKNGGRDSQSDNEGVGNLRQHLLLIVDVLLLFQPDYVRDFHLF